METGKIGESRQQTLERLTAEHRALAARVSELESKRSLTSHEQLELAKLKKLKLQTKDQLYMLGMR